MIRSLTLLPSCQSPTQVAVKLRLDSLPALPELVIPAVHLPSAFVVFYIAFFTSSMYFFFICVFPKYYLVAKSKRLM